MGTILVILIYFRVLLFMLLRLVFVLFGPFILLGAIIFAIRIVKAKIEKQKYYDYCKTHNISPADDDKNFFDMTRDNIYRERDSWL